MKRLLFCAISLLVVPVISWTFAVDFDLVSERCFEGPDGKILPFREDDEVLDFLRTAQVVSEQSIGEGVTGAVKMLLEKDGVQAHAIFRTVRERRRGPLNVRFDDFVFEVAAYELSRLLELPAVPPAIERRVRRRNGSLQIWIENAATEKERQSQGIRCPNLADWAMQRQVMNIFDNLIANEDRNQGNILYERSWLLWMVDHTRSFRVSSDLPNPELISYCEPHLWERLQEVPDEAIRQALEPYLQGLEIKGVLARRKKLVTHIQSLIDERGEGNVLFPIQSWPKPCPIRNDPDPPSIRK